MAAPLQQAFRLGTLALEAPLFLSPLAGYTNLPFRLLIRELGGVGLCTTDLVNARSLLERNPKALKLIETAPGDDPLAVQIFGAVAEEMRDAAQLLESLGVQSVDINMGCPVPKVCKVGGGSSMMRDPASTAALVRQIVSAVRIPVTCKMRLGWNDANITAPDLARALADAGVAAVFVHGRTRDQGFNGSVNLAGIRAVVEAVPDLPVIGNGDVTTVEAACAMVKSTGCAGVSIGRGAFYNPWIFQHIRVWDESCVGIPEPTFEERVRVMRRHLDLMVHVFGETKACQMFRKAGPWYAKRFGPASLFNKRVTQLASRLEFEQIIADFVAWRAPFLDEHGQLLPKYRPGTLALNFVDAVPDSQPAAARREAIPVPSGPVEYW